MSWSGQVIEVPPIAILGGPDAEGLPTVTGFEPGYRLNCDIATRDEALALGPGFEEFVVTPDDPACVFAGAEEDTVFLLFESFEQARASAIGAWWIDPLDDI